MREQADALGLRGTLVRPSADLMSDGHSTRILSDFRIQA